MGLDLTVSEQTDFREDSKGRMQYTVTELYNFNHNGYKIVEYVGGLSRTIDAKDFVVGLEQMKEDMLSIEHDGEHFANEESEL